MDDLGKLCKELARCKNEKCCYTNEIVCTSRKVSEYVKDSKNRFLKLNALIEIYNSQRDDITRISFIVSVAAFLTSTLGGILGYQNKSYINYVLFVWVVIFIVILISFVFSKRISEKRRWVKYIEVVMDHIEIDKLK